MCLSAAAIAALSAAASGVGMVMQNRAQNASMKNYNNQAAQQNQLLQQQFQDKNEKINAARESQARVFQNMAAMQDEENARQTQMLKDKASLFQSQVAQPEIGAGSPVVGAEAVARQEMAAPTQLAADYAAPSGQSPASSEDRILREHNAATADRQSARSSGIVAALSRMGATQDAASKQGALFSGMARSINDANTECAASSGILNNKLRRPEYDNSRFGQVIGEQASTPYFRGQEPWLRPANTTFGDILSGAGSIGLNSYFMGAPNKPTGVPK